MRNYENNEGKRVYVTEVIADNVRFLESNRESSNQSSSRPQNDPFQDDGKPIDVDPKNMPF
ncbi:Single-stranded DNA-binding protein ssb [compost metagenome]